MKIRKTEEENGNLLTMEFINEDEGEALAAAVIAYIKLNYPKFDISKVMERVIKQDRHSIMIKVNDPTSKSE